MHRQIIEALEEAKRELLKISETTGHAIRKQRALRAYHQACEIADFLKKPSMHTDERGRNLRRLFQDAMWWLFIKKPRKRFRVYHIALGFYKRGWMGFRYYALRLTNRKEAEFVITAYAVRYFGD